MSSLVISDQFRASFRGEIVLPESTTRFEQLRIVHNGTFRTRPAVYFVCRGASDVSMAIKFASDHKLKVGVRGQGHAADGAGAGTDGGALIVLSEMKGVLVDAAAQIARAEGGARLLDIDQEVFAVTRGALSAVLGIVPATGAGGLVLHGGIGYLTALHGLAVDNVVGAQVVLADGRIVEATKSNEHADLLWMVRGAASNIGVVTRIDLALHPVRKMVGGLFAFVAGHAEQVQALQLGRDLKTKHPQGVFGIVAVAMAPPGHPAHPKELILFHVGSWRESHETDADALARLQPLVDLAEKHGGIVLGGKPGPVPFAVFNGMLTALMAGMPPDVRAYWKGLFASRAEVTGEFISAAVERWSKRLIPAMGPALFALELHGSPAGASAGKLQSLTTFADGTQLDIPVGAMREFDFSIAFLGYYVGAENDVGVRNFVRETYDEMVKAAPASGTKYYANYDSAAADGDAGATSAVRKQAFGSSDAIAAKLKEVKRKYDPNNMFDRHNIKISL